MLIGHRIFAPAQDIRLAPSEPSNLTVPEVLLLNRMSVTPTASEIARSKSRLLPWYAAAEEENVRRTVDVAWRIGWRVERDNDDTCAEKLASLGFMSRYASRWFASPRPAHPPLFRWPPALLQWAGGHSRRIFLWHSSHNQGAFRSDLCRLVQLYSSGGVYVDNDLVLIGAPRVTRIRWHIVQRVCISYTPARVTAAVSDDRDILPARRRDDSREAEIARPGATRAAYASARGGRQAAEQRSDRRAAALAPHTPGASLLRPAYMRPARRRWGESRPVASYAGA